MNILHLSPEGQDPGPPVDLAAEGLKAFVQASGDYPAYGSAQAAYLALRSIELKITPDDLHRELAAQPNIFEDLAIMANNAHRHAGNDVYVTPDVARQLLGEVFRVAQEMSCRLSLEEIREIIEVDHPAVRLGGYRTEGIYMEGLKKRLGITPSP